MKESEKIPDPLYHFSRNAVSFPHPVFPQVRFNNVSFGRTELPDHIRIDIQPLTRKT